MLDRAPILPVRLGFVAVGLGLLLTSGSVFSQNAARNDAFPLDIGNSWAYVGTVWWTTPNSRRILKEQVNWRIEVVDVIERRGVRAAILRGLPQDMVVMGRGRAPAEYLLVQIGEDKLFLLSGQRINEALRQLRNPRDPLLGLVQDSELVLDLPLFPGKTFCAASNPAPGRRPACWTVREQGPINLAAVRGLSGARQRERYTLDLQWEGDDIVWGFVPGVGLTSYAIGHYGAVSAVELDLVEANVAGKPGVPFLKTLDLTEGESATRPTPVPGRSGSSRIGGERVEPASAAMVGSVAVPASGGAATTAGSQPVRNEPREPEPPRDADGDGVVDPSDACANTPAGAPVNSSGCPVPQDADGDGVVDPRDACPETPAGAAVNASGCPVPQDGDGDGVIDPRDACPETPAGGAVNESGCAIPQDGDGDAVVDPQDACPHTPPGAAVNASGCPIPGDADGDGIVDPRDVCPETPAGAIVDSFGCPPAPEPTAEEPVEMASPGPLEDTAETMEPPAAPAEGSAETAGQRPCADDREWFGSQSPIEFDGRRFEPSGAPEPIAVENLVVVGEHDGVLLLAGSLVPEPYDELWLPICSPAGSYHLYAEVDRSD